MLLKSRDHSPLNLVGELCFVKLNMHFRCPSRPTFSRHIIPSALAAVADGLIKMIKGTRRQFRERHSTGLVVVAYALSLTHSLKKVADRHKVPVVFSSLNKLSRLYCKINNPRMATDFFNTKHHNRFTEYATGVVNKMCISCGSSCGLITHANMQRLQGIACQDTRTHRSRCTCSPSFDDNHFGWVLRSDMYGATRGNLSKRKIQISYYRHVRVIIGERECFLWKWLHRI